MLFPLIWLIYCGRMNEPSKNNLGCNVCITSTLQPKAMIVLIIRLVLYGSLRRGYAGDGHAIGGARYVVHAEFGTELHT